jgi:hypothetical protein
LQREFFQSCQLIGLISIQANLYPTQDAYIGGCNNENNFLEVFSSDFHS